MGGTLAVELSAWIDQRYTTPPPGLPDLSVNPARLTLARERHGFTKQHFATLCEVSRRTVTAWESGEVDAAPLETIVQVLKFPPSFFWLMTRH